MNFSCHDFLSEVLSQVWAIELCTLRDSKGNWIAADFEVRAASNLRTQVPLFGSYLMITNSVSFSVLRKDEVLCP